MNNFDPIYIILQIICLQSLFYLGMGTILGIIQAFTETPMSLDRFFASGSANFDSFSGWVECFGILLSGCVGSFLLSVIVEKAKKCVDFTVTLYFLHIVVCTMYQSAFPFAWAWWLTHIIAGVLMASLGEYWCAVSELQEIPLYSSSN